MKTIRMGARLRAARKAAGFKTSKEFIKKYNIPASTYSQHESGARLPDDKTLKYYTDILKINFDWLKLGKGQPFKNITKIQLAILDEELLDLSLDLSKKSNLKKSLIHTDLLISVLEKIMSERKVSKNKDQLSIIAKEAASLYIKLIKNK